MSQLLGPKPLRALLFVHTLNQQGVFPTVSDISAFIETSPNNFDYAPMAEGLYRDTAEYLKDMRLLEVQDLDKMTLSPAGKAIFHSANASDKHGAEAHPVEVVGRMTNSFVYAELLTRIDDVPNSMVIDPYLYPRDVMALLQLSPVRRLLTRDTSIPGMSKEKRAQKLRIALGAGRDVELRFIPSDSKELHDRVVLPQDGGEALFIGTSLGGTQLTVITRLGADPTSALRKHYNSLWDRSTPLEPIQRQEPGE